MSAKNEIFAKMIERYHSLCVDPVETTKGNGESGRRPSKNESKVRIAPTAHGLREVAIGLVRFSIRFALLINIRRTFLTITHSGISYRPVPGIRNFFRTFFRTFWISGNPEISGKVASLLKEKKKWIEWEVKGHTPR